METQTRFDLNAAITNWQQELAAQPGLTLIVRRELETHLRDTVKVLQGRGLSDEESFWLARRRLGQPEQLDEEFAKADPNRVWRDRAFWMVLMLLVTTLWQSSVSLLNYLSLVNTEGSFLAARVLLMFASWLPILLGVLFLSKGRFPQGIGNRLAFFNSRGRVAAAVFSWIGVVAIIHSVDLWLRIMHLNSRGSIWVSILMSIIIPAAWPTGLVSLLLLIMPRPSRSAVQHP
jgi:hypothetical protein